MMCFARLTGRDNNHVGLYFDARHFGTLLGDAHSARVETALYVYALLITACVVTNSNLDVFITENALEQLR